MFVYGVPCSPQDLLSADIPENLTADYYADWQLLVFPAHTQPTALRSHNGQLTPAFWNDVRALIENPRRPRNVEREHPWLNEHEAAVAKSLGREPTWFYVPAVAVSQS
jgi:hypothetical protein